MNLRDLHIEDVSTALGHVPISKPSPVHNYTGMTKERAEDVNRVLDDLRPQEALGLVAILAERCAFVRGTTPLTELWDAREVDAIVAARMRRLLGLLP